MGWKMATLVAVLGVVAAWPPRFEFLLSRWMAWGARQKLKLRDAMRRTLTTNLTSR